MIADSLATASQVRQQLDNSLGLKLVVARLYLLLVYTLPRALSGPLCLFDNRPTCQMGPSENTWITTNYPFPFKQAINYYPKHVKTSQKPPFCWTRWLMGLLALELITFVTIIAN